MWKNICYERLVVYIIIFFLMCSGFTVSINANKKNNKIVSISEGNTLYVGGSGPGNYSKIQDAIDNASDSDTVFVYDDSSPYFENILVDKSINLVGEDKNTTIIDGGNDFACVDINADSVLMRGFTVQHADNGIAVMKNNTTITHNIARANNYTGIGFGGTNNTIINNIVSENREVGIFGTRTFKENSNTHSIITQNKISGNMLGICLYTCNNVKVNFNNILNNKIGVYLALSSGNSVLQNNFLNNTRSAYFARNIFLELRIIQLYGVYKILGKNFLNGNYWDEPLDSPKPIRGSYNLRPMIMYIYISYFVSQYYPIFPLNSVNFDWHPATEPYNIEGGIP